eukprot:gene16727-22996_t
MLMLARLDAAAAAKATEEEQLRLKALEVLDAAAAAKAAEEEQLRREIAEA